MATEQLEKKVSDSQNKLQTLLRANPQAQHLRLEEVVVSGYEQVLRISDKKSGLQAIIAIHNTALGPALGGIRIQPYKSFDQALEDVLRLAKGMTYKSAIAQVGFGGGKSVIIADPKRDKTPELLRSFGAAVQSLGGRYICAEDVGCTTEDVRIVRQQTQYVVGLPHEKSSGDPGPFTAWGTFRGIETCATKLFGSPSLVGKSVAIQGLGNVGAKLVEYLFWAGAKVLIADIDQAKCERMSAQWGAEVVPIEKILSVPCDIFAPCALGAVINDETIASFRCKAIAGCANNQLHRDEHALALMKQGILYAPDFVINAGGLLNVATELDAEGYLPTASQRKVHAIYDTLLAVFEIAETHRQSTHEAALALADYRLQYGIGRRERSPTFHHTPEM